MKQTFLKVFIHLEERRHHPVSERPAAHGGVTAVQAAQQRPLGAARGVVDDDLEVPHRDPVQHHVLARGTLYFVIKFELSPEDDL